MLYLIPSAILLCIASFFLGYYLHSLKREIKQLEKVMETKVSKKPEPEEPQSTIIDPLDEVAEALYARDQLMKKMNPE